MTPPDSHWHGVLSLLELSDAQKREAVSMGELFVQLLGKVSPRGVRLLAACLHARRRCCPCVRRTCPAALRQWNRTLRARERERESERA